MTVLHACPIVKKAKQDHKLLISCSCSFLFLFLSWFKAKLRVSFTDMDFSDFYEFKHRDIVYIYMP